jgi:hypothetical protein
MPNNYKEIAAPKRTNHENYIVRPNVAGDNRHTHRFAAIEAVPEKEHDE